MSEILAVLAAAALFAGFGWLARGRPPRGCGSCAHRESGACDACPFPPKETRP